jgi:hypothetical protein
MIDLKKERNFFETRVIEYQTGGALNWEWHFLQIFDDNSTPKL